MGVTREELREESRPHLSSSLQVVTNYLTEDLDMKVLLDGMRIARGIGNTEAFKRLAFFSSLVHFFFYINFRFSFLILVSRFHFSVTSFSP